MTLFCSKSTYGVTKGQKWLIHSIKVSRYCDKDMNMLYYGYMNNQFLEQIGLTKDQASVYEAIIMAGTIPARVICQKVGIKRGLTYKIIDQLIDLGLIEKREEDGRITLFRSAHPSKLNGLLEKKQQEVKNAEISFNLILPSLISNYNLNTGKPNVELYEGMEGIIKVADDSLTSITEIYSFIDNEAVNKYAPEVNAEYVRRTKNEKIKKKMIAIDSQYIRERVNKFDPNLTEVRVIDKNFGFSTVIQIYDNKISYITLEESRRIGVIVEDLEIYKMHKTLFEYIWEKAEQIFPMQQHRTASLH